MRITFAVLINIYQVFALNKMKAHLKEYDRFVTLRFDDIVNAEAQSTLKKREKFVKRQTSIMATKGLTPT